MKRNTYEVEKNIEKILRGNSTGFLSPNIKQEITKKLKKDQYNIFSPFNEAEKIIIYSKTIPHIKLFKVNCYKTDKLTHSAIMGSLFGLNITSEMFGDIINYNNHFYIYLLDSISDLVTENLKIIGTTPISLEEVDSNLLKNYSREYESIKLIVSSLRLDTIISKLASCNREKVITKIKNQEILINDIPAAKTSTLLKPNDIFSIRKIGKFKFKEIMGTTKKDNLIIEINKYI